MNLPVEQERRAVTIGCRVRARCDLVIPSSGDHPAMIVAPKGTEGVVEGPGRHGFHWEVRMRTTASGEPEESVLVWANEIEVL